MPKLLLRWVDAPYSRTVLVLTVYRIERNRWGVLVCRIVERVDSEQLNQRPDLRFDDVYAPGTSCHHNRPACPFDLRAAAGCFVIGTPDEVVRDWWDENYPMTGDQWRRAEKRKAKQAARRVVAQ